MTNSNLMLHYSNREWNWMKVWSSEWFQSKHNAKEKPERIFVVCYLRTKKWKRIHKKWEANDWLSIAQCHKEEGSLKKYKNICLKNGWQNISFQNWPNPPEQAQWVY